MNDNQITYLDINSIFPHPNNPRKELGSLTELADSVKTSGIMQNLTVVRQPWSVNDTKPIRYTVIIGHRRLAAAKQAGLKEVPCVIAEMDEKTQVSTMLLENMQRSDLTPIEEAQGFQMMLDLGETAKSMSQKTGLSEKTIRKRLFVASLNAKKAETAYERGATLEDYMKLQQISDKEKRDKVLETLGTNNFNYNLRNAIAEELKERVSPEIIKKVETFAKPTDKPSWELRGYAHYRRYLYEDYERRGKIELNLPKKWEPDEYIYFVSSSSIDIYKKQEGFISEKKMSELSTEEQEERREKRRKYKALKEMGETIYQLRLAFVKSFSRKPGLDIVSLKALSEFAFAAVCLGGRLDFEFYSKLEELKVENIYQMKYPQKKDAMKQAKAPDARVLLLSLYSTFRDSAENTYFHGSEAPAEKRGYHKGNSKLDAIYDCLCELGYQMSDEEQALRDGTHELLESAEG